MNINNHYSLEQVVILSRHGIRSPLPDDKKLFSTVTNKQWPEWNCPYGYLTLGGRLLEIYFGNYFALWLAQHNLLQSEQLHDPNAIFVYSNSLQRTVATAQAFLLGAFPGYDIKVHHRYPIEKNESVFNPIIRQISDERRAELLADMQQSANKQTNILNSARRQQAYQLLSDIVDDSQDCFAHEIINFDIASGLEPIAAGTLRVANAITDAFKLQYYEGFSEDNVAWGKIEGMEKWHILSEIKNQYMQVLFKSPKVALHVAKPILNAMYQKLMQYELLKHPCVSLFVGHDSNIATVLQALNFEDYHLQDQFENTPIGGKVFFERWYDHENKQYLFRTEYVYQTAQQIRNKALLDLDNPPKHVILKLAGLTPYANGGFYLWQDVKHRFDAVLNHLDFS